MKTLAEMVVGAAAFLEFAGDDVLDPDDAVRQLEDFAYRLQRASEEEKQAVLAVCRELVLSMPTRADQKQREFYEKFGDNFGITPDEKKA